MATGGLRNELALTAAQRAEALGYAKSLGIAEDSVTFTENMNTAYSKLFGQERLYIGTDVLPAAEAGLGPNSYISMRGSIAHELVGHRAAALAGETQAVTVLEEAQASIRAARFAPGLSQSERWILLRDANNRLRNAGMMLRGVRGGLWISEWRRGVMQ